MGQFGAEYFKLSPELLSVFDFEGNFIDVNPSWEKILGWNKEECLKHSFGEYIHPDDIEITKIEFKKLCTEKNHTTFNFENRYRHKNGSYRWLQWSGSLIQSENKIFGMARDITEAKRESILLAETEEVALVGSWEIDLSTNELFWSKMTHLIHETDFENYRPKLNDGLSFYDHHTSELLSRYIQKLTATGEPYDLELPFITAKGRKTVVRVVARASMRNGVVLRAFGTIEDVGLKKREKSRYELIVETSEFGTWDWDLETDNVYFNERWCSMLGLDMNKVEHKLSTWDNLAHPEDKLVTYKDIKDHLEGRTPYYRNVHRMKHVNGKWVWILDQGKVVQYHDGRPVRFSGTHTDITYLKELENEKVILNDRFKLVLASIKLGVWDWNVADNTLMWDDSMYDLFGINKKDFNGPLDAWMKSVHPEDIPRISACFTTAITEQINLNTTFRVLKENNEIRHIAVKGYVERDQHGVGVRISGIDWDITKEIDQERVFESIVNNIPILITFYNKEGQIEWINSHMIETLGWNFDDIYSDDKISSKFFATDADLNSAIEFMNSAPDEWREFSMKKKNGEIAHTIWTNVRLSNGKAIGIGQDIGEKKRQEDLIRDQQARMISSAKLSSLGEMASGIAHEINNPLAIIKGKAYQVLKKLESGDINIDFLSKEIAKIEHNSLRIVKIIKGLRTFSRHGEADPFQLVVFKSVLDDVLELCHERFKHQGVELKISGELETQIFCQETQFAQVLLNLINNAHDAVFGTENPWVEIHVARELMVTKITVTDSGHGISQEIANKIMQPFFTTKDVGTGTGLGLSISKGIVEMHKGKLYLDQSCQNTRFVIELPANAEYVV